MAYLPELRPTGERGWSSFPRTVDEMFQRFMAPFTETRGGWFPQMDVIENADSYVVKAEVPGIDPKDVEVTLTSDRLTIRGERRHEEKKEGEHWHSMERSYGSFERTFSFPTPVASDGVDAEIKNGVLHVTVKKSKEAQPRRIAVKGR